MNDGLVMFRRSPQVADAVPAGFRTSSCAGGALTRTAAVVVVFAVSAVALLAFMAGSSLDRASSSDRTTTSAATSTPAPVAAPAAPAPASASTPGATASNPTRDGPAVGLRGGDDIVETAALVSTIFQQPSSWIPRAPESKVQEAIALLGQDVPPSSGMSPRYKNPCWMNADGKLCCLPSFYLIGMSKGGTTDLWRRLGNHPNVTATTFDVKEPKWWSRTIMRRGQTQLSHYLDRYQPNCDEIAREPHLVFGDTSADTYTSTGMKLRDVPIPQLLTSVQPASTKYAISLRDPVSRLYSAFKFYFFQLAKFNAAGAPIPADLELSSEYFHIFVKRSITNLQACLAAANPRDALVKCVITSKTARWPPYVGNHIYIAWLQQWRHLTPGHELAVFRTEDLHADASGGAALNSVFEALGVGRLPDDELSSIMKQPLANKGQKAIAQSIGPMLPETERLLRDFYRPWNTQLALYLGDNKFLWDVGEH